MLTPEADDDELTDVGLVYANGQRHLFLKPQSFDSAVRQVSSVMPDLPLEQVERLVREHCAEFKDFDELLGPVEAAPAVEIPTPPTELPRSARPRWRGKKWTVAAVLVPTVAGAWALGHFTGGNTLTGVAGASAPSHATTTDQAGPQPFVDSQFMDFSNAGKISCNPIDNLEAECTDSDGIVMATKAATGPDSTIFTFSYGSQRIGLRIFADTEYAATWTKQDASVELYPNMDRVGRYVLWGTDKERLEVYLKLLRAAPTPPKVPAVARPMGSVEPLPARLAALALGTLGLDEQELRRILSEPQEAGFDRPVAMAARAVLGMTDGTSPSLLDSDGDDIVALAAGIERRPATSSPGTGTSTPEAVAVVDSAASQPNSKGEVPRPPRQTSPSTDQPPNPKPVEEEPVERRPIHEKPIEGRPIEEKPVKPGGPAEPEQQKQPPTAPNDPEPPVTEQPTPEKAPRPADNRDATDKRPVVPTTEDDDSDGELLVLPRAWVAPST
ncbi:hypothetical protein ACO0M4_09815 [Streptomyces sp. RGM 3693]|uniref:hypothetical protein n=1 Tax=Streptomyces sp. RGM 3693 TaxID=3413284 RepID=UPI003D266197